MLKNKKSANGGQPLHTYLPAAVATAIKSNTHSESVIPELEPFLRSVTNAKREDFTTYMSKFFFLQSKTREKLPCKVRNKKSYLSLTDRRRIGLYNLKRTGLKFNEFLPLHNLWKEYMTSYLNLDYLKGIGFTGNPLDKQWDQFSMQLLKADFHGAKVEITRSKCSSLVGKTGLIVYDTKNTFKIIGVDNLVRTIPKETSVFVIELDVYKFTVFGKHLCTRPAARSVKKIKLHLHADL